jgi:hypothetical protein
LKKWSESHCVPLIPRRSQRRTPPSKTGLNFLLPRANPLQPVPPPKRFRPTESSARSRSADLQSAVSRIFNPPGVAGSRPPCRRGAPPNAIRRYSRLQICVTLDAGICFPPSFQDKHSLGRAIRARCAWLISFIAPRPTALALRFTPHVFNRANANPRDQGRPRCGNRGFHWISFRRSPGGRVDLPMLNHNCYEREEILLAAKQGPRPEDLLDLPSQQSPRCSATQREQAPRGDSTQLAMAQF